MVEVDKGISRPKLGAQLFPRDKLSGTRDEYHEDLKRLADQPDSGAMLPELVGVGIHLVRPESHST
jgi:hypothetical protein